MPESISHGDLHLFADDTTVYTSGKDTDMIISSLLCILSLLHIWCSSNRLIAQESKTEAMIISRSIFIGSLPALRYGTKTIELKSKCLGLSIDNKFSWQDYICNLFNKNLAVLKRSNSCLSPPWDLFISTQLFPVLYIMLFGALFPYQLWRILNVFIWEQLGLSGSYLWPL